jgi:pimeloyl-ACP methyl ester carboxylesterase
MIALVEAGFHAIVPDFRGYGLSDQPFEPEKAAYYDLVEDLVGLLDALGMEKVSL